MDCKRTGKTFTMHADHLPLLFSQNLHSLLSSIANNPTGRPIIVIINRILISEAAAASHTGLQAVTLNAQTWSNRSSRSFNERSASPRGHPQHQLLRQSLPVDLTEHSHMTWTGDGRDRLSDRDFLHDLYSAAAMHRGFKWLRLLSNLSSESLPVRRRLCLFCSTFRVMKWHIPRSLCWKYLN